MQYIGKYLCTNLEKEHQFSAHWLTFEEEADCMWANLPFILVLIFVVQRVTCNRLNII